MRVNFCKLQKKYPLLKDADSSLLKIFFIDKKVNKIFSEYKKDRPYIIKNIIKYNIYILIIFLLIFFFFKNKPELYKIPLFLFILSNFIIPFLVSFTKNFDIHYYVLPKLFKYAFPKIKYKMEKGVSNKDIKEIKRTCPFKLFFTLGGTYAHSIKFGLGTYIKNDIEKSNTASNDLEIIDSTDIKDDFTKESIDILGFSGGINDYLLTIKFNNPKINIKKGIHVIMDPSYSIFNQAEKFVKFLFANLNTILLSFFILTISIIAPVKYYLGNIEGLFSFLIITFFIFFISFIFYKNSEKKIELENIDFEKKFDVHSEDPIEARKLLTPSFMYRLFDYSNKIVQGRIYEFYFIEDTFYIKYKLFGKINFFNINKFDKTIEKIVRFYLEIKNIKGLVKDLKLFYYDKGTYDKEIIK